MTQTKAELLQTRHQGDIRLGDANSSHYVGFKAPATVGSNLVWTLPAADGTANYLLKTDGSGNLGWVADSSTDSTKMPLAGGTFTGNVTSNDNVEARFGTGADLKIFHNATHSFIQHTYSSGNFFIESAANIAFKVASNESSLNLNSNGSVELFHDNVKTFETISNGIRVLGTENDAAYIYMSADEGDDNADKWVHKVATTGVYSIGNYSTGSWVDGLTLDGSNNATFAGSTQASQVGIGAAPAAYQHLHITAADPRVRIESSGTNAAKIQFADSSSGDVGVIEYSHGSNAMMFNTNSTAALTLDSSQNATFVGNITVSNLQPKIFLTDTNNTSDFSIQNENGNLNLYDETNSASRLRIIANGGAYFGGAIYGPVKTVSALELDLSTGNYFTKTISGNSTFTFANPAASGTATAFTLELTHSSGTVTWPSSVKWNADTAPTLTTGKTHLFMFVTDDGGTRYRGSALVDYVN